MIALRGRSFCWSTFKAVKLIIANVARMATAAVVTTIVTILGQLVIVIGSASFSWVFIKNIMVPTDQYGNEIYIASIAVPVTFTALISFFVARCIMGVYEMAMDTILL